MASNSVNPMRSRNYSNNRNMNNINNYTNGSSSKNQKIYSVTSTQNSPQRPVKNYIPQSESSVYQQQQNCPCPSSPSKSSCSEDPEPVTITKKICPEKCVHVPQFVILPMINEEISSTTPGQSLGPFDHIPIVGTDYPYDNAMTSDSPPTWVHYEITHPTSTTWFATPTTTVYTINLWGHGPDNFDYYIGDNLIITNNVDVTPINYINFLPTANPSASDIAAPDNNRMMYLNPRGYLTTNFWGSDIYYFQFRVALRRYLDNSAICSSPPYRYYLEFQRLDAPFGNGIWPTLQPQLISDITLPEVGPDIEVPPYFGLAPVPLDTDFKYTPTMKYKVALWGQQGPQTYSRLSHSAEVDSIIPELSSAIIAEKNFATTPNVTTQAALIAANNALKIAYPKIRVWPSIERPLSLDAWVGVKPPCILTQYYICKFFVGTNASDPNLLELTSTATTQPIGAPIAYPHYNTPDLYYDWTVPASYPNQLGVAPVIPYTTPNPTVVEGYGGPLPGTVTNPVVPGTIGRLRFIPIESNNNYVGNVPVSLKNPNIPVPDAGFALFFQLEREIGLTQNTLSSFIHSLDIRRLTPFPQEYPRNMLGDAQYMAEPSLLLPNRYPLLPSIDFMQISTNENPQWSNPQYRFVDYYGFFEGPQGPLGITGSLVDETNPKTLPSGIFQYHNRQRLLGESDDNTVILKIDWNVYDSKCDDC